MAALALMAAFLVSSGQAKEKPEDFTEVYTHTYDEVFRAAQEEIGSMGMFVTDKDQAVAKEGMQ